MCGIVGYTGAGEAAPILLSGLERLEYRGYDSAGIAVRDGGGAITVIKSRGRLSALREKVAREGAPRGGCGIGHTRWATHGAATEENAHPHFSDGMDVVGVHNGIIENHAELREKLIRKGYGFYSETDTETAVKLIDYYFKKYRLGAVDALAKAMVRMRGSYALAVMFRDLPGQIWTARKDSPLIIGEGDGECCVASDVCALPDGVRRIYYTDDLEMACVTPRGVRFYDLNGDCVEKTPSGAERLSAPAEKGGFEHFMLKEIHEQPDAVRATLAEYVSGDEVDLSRAGISDVELRDAGEVCFFGCGSAYHVGIAAVRAFGSLAGMPAQAIVASEFAGGDVPLDSAALAVFISQSGETADTIAALRECRRRGIPTLAVVNVEGSTLAREAERVMYTRARQEIAVATTKAFSAQLTAVYLLALRAAFAHGRITETEARGLVRELACVPDCISEILDDKSAVQRLAAELSAARDVFYIGRGDDLAVCMEGSLKMKEITYLHSEAYPAGELKHGTISLIERGTPLICVAADPARFDKTLSNAAEAQSRGARVIAVTTRSRAGDVAGADLVIPVPDCHPAFAALLTVVPLQLLGYYASVARGLDVDKPRNLAKSVTVS